MLPAMHELCNHRNVPANHGAVSAQLKNEEVLSGANGDACSDPSTASGSASGAARATASTRSSSPLAFRVLTYAGFVVLYVLLDCINFATLPYGLGEVAWDPAAGITMFFVLTRGAKSLPIVILAGIISQGLLPSSPASWVLRLMVAVIVAAAYGGASAFLKKARFDATFQHALDLILFFIAAVGAAIGVACGVVAVHVAAGLIHPTEIVEAFFYNTVADVIGSVVIVPPLLAVRALRNSASHVVDKSWSAIAIIEVLGQVIVTIAVPITILSRAYWYHPFELLYLLFLPIVWIAARWGFAAVSWAVITIQVVLMVGADLCGFSQEVHRAFQFLMIALTFTGLMLGVTVSERRRLSEALSESESRRAIILKAARIGIMSVSSSGTIRSANPAAGEVFGQPADSILNQNIADFITLEPAQLEELSRDGSLDQETGGAELQARRSDGAVIPIELSVGSAGPSGAGEYTLMIRDISQRKNAEQERRTHLSELARFSRVALAGEMAAALAHEISQPLGAILAYARGCMRFLARPVTDNQVLVEGVSEIVNQSERVAHITVRLRELVRYGTCQRSFVPVRRMIEASVGLARTEALPKGISIQLDVAPRLPPVFADPIQIEQVLLNLFRNSIDAIADGAQRMITVKARQNGASVEISVRDTGSGISEEMQELIFEPFLTTKDDGMGMGLAISRRIIRAHGGNLMVAPSTGPGATFTFNLPTQVAKDDLTD